MFDHIERETVSAGHSLDDVKLRDAAEHEGQCFLTQPGDGGAYMATIADEWISSGNDVSISIRGLFYTDYTRRQTQLHKCNAVPRRLEARVHGRGPRRLWRRAKVRYKGYEATLGCS